MGFARAEAPVEVSPPAVPKLSTENALALLVALGFALRLYLALTSYCMSGDGVGFLRMAQEFAVGETKQALASVFSPLYPALVAVVHPLLPNWELAAGLISVAAGTAAIATIFGLTRAIFDRRDLALGAAAIAAFHPDLAAYAASVRTEAGFTFLTTAALWLIVGGLRRRSIIVLAFAGLVGGLAYLYRTEAIGLLIFIGAFIPAGAILWRRWNFGWSLVAAAVFSIAFLTVASPYLIFLHSLTGRWSVGREFTAAMILGMGNATPNTASWKGLGFSPVASPFAPVFSNPGLYLLNSARHFTQSCYGFVQSLGLVLTAFLLAGLWARGRSLAMNFAEALIGLFVVFYLFGFSLSYTGARFMSHLIPYTFGWVMAGVEAVSIAFAAIAERKQWPHVPQSALLVLIIAVMLPRALWPIGYDQRGLRYAGEQIRNSSPGGTVVAAHDGRVAYYGNARFVMLPESQTPDLCEWLGLHHASYLLLTDQDETQLRLYNESGCLKPMRRYPRHGNLYYDLFAVVSPD